MADTAKEKALKVLAKQIKELDNNSLNLDVLKSKFSIDSARDKFFDIIKKHGYDLTQDYKLIKNK